MTEQSVDYIVVGAGSAGCVLANRLTEDGQRSVLLLEYGGSDRSIYIQMPSALAIPMNREQFNWFYHTEPEPGLNNRRMHTPRGKVLGGSSSINGMVYVRGNPFDFERWQELGATGWGYRDVLPYFKRAERRATGGDTYRGGDGLLGTCYGPQKNPLHAAWLAAGQQAGYPRTQDMNGFQQEGFGSMDMTVENGVRASAANAYLKPARARANLTVWTETRVLRVLFEGKRAIGVRVMVDGVEKTVRAKDEVILSAGSIASPQLLKLSGVGAGAELQQFSIPQVHELPGVGENLQDHLEVYFQVACKEPITLYSVMNPFSKLKIGVQWLLFKNGLGATNHFETCAFIRSRAGIRYPDIQYHFLPMAVSYDGSDVATEHGFQAHVGPMRSKSRGWVRLASRDAADKPKVQFNYMSHPDDLPEFRAAVRLTREIFAQPAFDRYRGREIAPGAEMTSDEQIDAFVREKVESAYHPSCSCKMGAASDPMAVVGADTRVLGLDGLRVVDSSIMPAITNGNLNAPTIMLAEKAADHIRGKAMLARAEVPFYEAPQWQTAQR